MKKTFKAVLEPMGTLGWTVARVPFDPAKVWAQMIRLRVRGEMAAVQRTSILRGGFAFRTSLFPFAGNDGYFLLVNRSMQEASGVTCGGMASFKLEPDLEPRPAELPEELAVLLDQEPGLRDFYDSFSEYARREIGKWVLGVKSEAAKMRRTEQMAERLLATMEAERELPPAIAIALRRRPKSQAGWRKMTPTQRRMELFAVHYYQTPAAREKRITKLCEAAEKKA